MRCVLRTHTDTSTLHLGLSLSLKICHLSGVSSVSQCQVDLTVMSYFLSFLRFQKSTVCKKTPLGKSSKNAREGELRSLSFISSTALFPRTRWINNTNDVRKLRS